uniref:Uncharacterized protein n=1 Tax=Brassica oleracea TaxID=3712 RepID=A0A3P6EAJ9_BRAOL|nr:unnamed protein product [Brassica oleracea]
MALSLNLLDEKREPTTLRNWSYHQDIAKSYTKRVRTRTFPQGDRVLRRVFENKKNKPARKLVPEWEGPYKVIEVRGA